MNQPQTPHLDGRPNILDRGQDSQTRWRTRALQRANEQTAKWTRQGAFAYSQLYLPPDVLLGRDPTEGAQNTKAEADV